MVLHTIVDIAEIMIDAENDSCEPSLQGQDIFMQRGNAYFKGRKTQNSFIIDRVISTNPSDYLNPQYGIGQRIK